MRPIQERPARRPSDRREPLYLLSYPQPLGVLPTLWFWEEVRAERPVIGMLTGLAVGGFAVLIGQMLLGVGLALPVVFVVALCLPMLGLGIIERCLRLLVIHRRRMLARGEGHQELPARSAEPQETDEP